MSCSRGCCVSAAAHFRSVALTKVLAKGNRKDDVLSKDMAAYRRLIDDGLEPASIHGAAKLEATGASAHRIEGRPEPVVGLEQWTVPE